jgi:hypothetical protein
MAGSLQLKKQDELVRVHTVLETSNNPFSNEEVHFVQTCQDGRDGKVALNAATALDSEREDPSRSIKEIQRLLETFWVEAEAHRSQSPTLYQTTWNVECLEAYTCSLEHLEGSVRGLDKAPYREFTMGIKMAQFDMTKSLEDFRISLERVGWQPTGLQTRRKSGRREGKLPAGRS